MRLGNKPLQNKAQRALHVKRRSQRKRKPRLPRVKLNLKKKAAGAATAIRRAAIKASAINVNAWLS